jgi:hypothetical protein
MRFFKKLLKGQQCMPLKVVTDKLKSYSAAKKELIPSVEYSTVQYDVNSQLNLNQFRMDFGLNIDPAQIGQALIRLIKKAVLWVTCSMQINNTSLSGA